jgi:hypothetical protein
LSVSVHHDVLVRDHTRGVVIELLDAVARTARIYSVTKVRRENNLDLRAPRLNRAAYGEVASESVDHHDAGTAMAMASSGFCELDPENETVG